MERKIMILVQDGMVTAVYTNTSKVETKVKVIDFDLISEDEAPLSRMSNVIEKLNGMDAQDF